MKRITTIALHSVFLVALVFSTGYTLAQKETQEKQQTEKKQVLAQSIPRPLPSDVQKETQEKQQTEKKQVPVQSVPRPLPDMTRRVQEANKAFRDAVASEMQAAARQAGVKIRTDNFVAIPFDDSGTVVVNAMIEGADRLSIEELAKGADVLFVYSGAKLGSADRRGVPYILVDHGFYVVRVSQNPASGQWIAQFKNLQGRVVLETEAIVEKPDSNAAKMQPMCTLGPKGELILFDEHDRFKNITLSVSSKRFPPGGGAGGVILVRSRTLREAAWQVVKEVAKEPVSIEQVVPVSLGPVPLPDAITVLFNCGTENKPDWCECTLVERGSDYAIWSCIGQKSKKWYVFYVLRE
ncbi:hypothetical protein ACVW0Q_002076 [Thermostichus sp. MS-CIW-21]|jgi:hypothetical protein